MGELLSGKKSPPKAPRLTVFDSTGVAVQDVKIAELTLQTLREAATSKL